SIAAWELDYRDMAHEFFRYTALMDLADVGGNVKDGVHVASLGGTWMAVVYGLAGMRDYDGALSFDPRSADDTVVKFPLIVRGQEMEVSIEGPTVTYLLRRGAGLTIRHRDEAIELVEGEPVARPTNLIDENQGGHGPVSTEA
ncbi:MAG: glycosyl hydrolase family 65 protein, partial [Pseudomonadota bacterium]